jgi:hypothetical protein
MRTTIDLGEDIFYAAKAYAKTNKQTMGEVITAWAREKFDKSAAYEHFESNNPSRESAFKALGFRTLPPATGQSNMNVPISNDTVNQLRQREGV